jgi:hypothetical protein
MDEEKHHAEAQRRRVRGMRNEDFNHGGHGETRSYNTFLFLSPCSPCTPWFYFLILLSASLRDEFSKNIMEEQL